MQSRLEQYLDEVSQPLPATERPEWRMEAEQHLNALVAAYEELGHSREEATELALARFGEPRPLSRQMRRESLATGVVRSGLARGGLMVLQTSLMWTAIWGTIGVGVVGLAGLLDSPGSDFGETLLGVMRLLGGTGFTAGMLFGLLLLAGERGRRISETPILRAALWGATAGALSTLLGFNQADPSKTGVLGFVAAIVTVVACRVMEKRRLDDAPVRAS